MPEQANSRSQAGKILGGASTESKARAARENGKAGGRPVGTANNTSNKIKKKDKDK